MKPWYEELAGFIATMLTKDKLTEFGATDKDLQGAITTKVDLGSGYSVDAEREKKAAQLRQLCMEAVNNPAWVPANGRTYCNRATNFIAQGMGHFFPFDAMANDMVSSMASSPEWRQEHDLARIPGLAMRGTLVVFGLQEQPHGHVCVAYPGPPQMSGSWGREVPMAANVGRKNGIMRLSEAFKKDQPPRAFVLEASVI